MGVRFKNKIIKDNLCLGLVVIFVVFRFYYMTRFRFELIEYKLKEGKLQSRYNLFVLALCNGVA